MIRSAAVTAVVLVASCTPVPPPEPADIGADLAAIAPGTTYLIAETTDGTTVRYLETFAVGAEGLYAIERRLAARPGMAPIHVEQRDASGNLVLRGFESGSIETYLPHDCSHVIGTCTYLARTGTAPYGERGSTVTRETTASPDGWSYTVTMTLPSGETTVVERGMVIGTDAAGLPLRIERTDFRERDTVVTRTPR